MAETTIPTQANPNVVATTDTNNVYTNIEPMHVYDDVEGVEDVLDIWMLHVACSGKWTPYTNKT